MVSLLSLKDNYGEYIVAIIARKNAEDKYQGDFKRKNSL
jgi:hypothetical protein